MQITVPLRVSTFSIIVPIEIHGILQLPEEGTIIVDDTTGAIIVDDTTGEIIVDDTAL